MPQPSSPRELAFCARLNSAFILCGICCIDVHFDSSFDACSFVRGLLFFSQAMSGSTCIGCVVCRVTYDKRGSRRGYIAMLAVSPLFRGKAVGTTLVQMAIRAMAAPPHDAYLIILEAEVTNKGALGLYEKLNFVRSVRRRTDGEIAATSSQRRNVLHAAAVSSSHHPSAVLRLFVCSLRRESRLVKYYLSGSDAYRLKLWIKTPEQEGRSLMAGQQQPIAGGGHSDDED